MEQRSDRHSAREDDALKRDTRGMVQSNRGERIEQWRDPEPPGDDEPEVHRAAGGVLEGPEPTPLSRSAAEERSELAAALRRTMFPTDKSALLDFARDSNAPDHVVALLEQLPPGVAFENVEQLWEASGHEGEPERF